MSVRFLLMILCLLLPLTNGAQAGSWSSYRDPASRYTIDLPNAPFEPSSATGGIDHITLEERTSEVILDVYAGNNVELLAPRAFIEQLARASRIADISYEVVGSHWFAVSGHYIREKGDPGTLIYYAKFVFSRDLSRFAAFEVSYPVAEKSRMDPVMIRLEKSLRLVD